MFIKKITILIIALIFCFSGIIDLQARRSSSRRSSSRRAPTRRAPVRKTYTPKKTSTKKSSWNKQSSSSAKAKTTARSSKTKGTNKYSTGTGKAKMSAADKKVAATAKKNGTYYKDSKSAKSAFRKKHASTYTSKYKTKPTTRPKHIPSTYKTSNGRTVNVTYNQGYGGYGYMNSMGTWMAYNMMADSIMYNRAMRRHGYAYGEPVVVYTSGWVIFWSILIGLIILGLVVFSIYKAND